MEPIEEFDIGLMAALPELLPNAEMEGKIFHVLAMIRTDRTPFYLQWILATAENCKWKYCPPDFAKLYPKVLLTQGIALPAYPSATEIIGKAVRLAHICNREFVLKQRMQS